MAAHRLLPTSRMNDERKPTVICVGGSATIDSIYLVDEVRLPSAKLTARDFVETGGGMGANAAVAVQRLGGQAIYWGRVGDDETGDQVIALLKHEGVDVDYLRRLPGFRTKIATILIDANGERLVISVQPQGYPPEASWLPVERVADADAVLADTRWLAGAQRLFDSAAATGKPSVFDGDGGDPNLVAATATKSTHPFFSESLLTSLQLGEPADALQRVFGGRNVVCGVTLGGEGVLWYDGQRVRHFAAPKIKPVDTLAAGDTWHGAFALALAERRNIYSAIEFATAVAAMKCLRFGGRAGIPRRDAFEQWWGERVAATA